MFNPNCRDKAYTAADFEALDKGTVLILHYNDTNKGTFVWVHDSVVRTDDDFRALGQFAYPDAPLHDVGAYLYEFEGFMCRGSGAEPVCREMPEDGEPEEDEDEEGREAARYWRSRRSWQ